MTAVRKDQRPRERLTPVDVLVLLYILVGVPAFWGFVVYVLVTR